MFPRISSIDRFYVLLLYCCACSRSGSLIATLSAVFFLPSPTMPHPRRRCVRHHKTHQAGSSSTHVTRLTVIYKDITSFIGNKKEKVPKKVTIRK